MSSLHHVEDTWSLWRSRWDEEIIRNLDWALSLMAAPSHTPLLFLPHLLPHPLESNGAWGSVLGPLPFSIYTHIFRDLIHSRGFMYPPYSDDFLVFVSNAYPDLHTYTANYLQTTYTWKPNRHPNTMSTKTAWCSSLSLLLLQASSF